MIGQNARTVEKEPRSIKRKNAKSSKKATAAIVLLSVLLVSVSAAFVTVYVQQKQNAALLQTRINELTEQKKSLESRINTWQQKAEYEENRYYSLKRTYQTVYERYDWLERNVVFVVNGDNTYYHSYLCSAFQNCDTYRAYNVEAARSNGYRAHSECK